MEEPIRRKKSLSYTNMTVISAECLPNLNAKCSIRPSVPMVRIAGRPSSITSVSAEFSAGVNWAFTFVSAVSKTGWNYIFESLSGRVDLEPV
jgi:hypothetical protein